MSIASTALLTLLLALLARPATAFDHFITRDGAELRDGERPFRFISVNIPNYFIVEDRASAEGPQWHRVTEFEQRDAARTVQRLGGEVFRVYSFSVEGGRNVEGKLAHIYDDNGHIAYHEELFRDVDRGLAIAEEHGLRVIIPLLDNWEWFGGFAQWAKLAHARDFWSDPAARREFKAFVVWLLNRRNSVTGRLYKDDPTILAWELGNEIEAASDSWLQEMAAFIKQHDTNHLLIDGGHKQLSFAALYDPNIDIVTTHYTNDKFDRFAAHAAEMNKGYLYGEFSPLPGPAAVSDIVSRTIKSPAVGALAWSLRFHADSGGFYFHSDFSGQSDSLHYPGFASTLPAREEDIFAILRRGAYAIQGKTLQREELPAAPQLLPTTTPSEINWRGAAGASHYSVQRRQGESSPWVTIAEQISDALPQSGRDGALSPHKPLFSDQPAAGLWSYRVIAHNQSGDSLPSNSIEIAVVPK